MIEDIIFTLDKMFDNILFYIDEVTFGDGSKKYCIYVSDFDFYMKDKKFKVKEVTVLVRKYLNDQKLPFAILASISFSYIALQIYSPQIIRNFIDEITGRNDKNVLFRFAAIYIAAAFLMQCFRLLSTYMSQNIGWKATNRLRNDLTWHCMNLVYCYE